MAVVVSTLTVASPFDVAVSLLIAIVVFSLVVFTLTSDDLMLSSTSAVYVPSSFGSISLLFTYSLIIVASWDNFLITKSLFSTVPSSAITVIVNMFSSLIVVTSAVAVCLFKSPVSIFTVACSFSVSTYILDTSTELSIIIVYFLLTSS